MRFLEIIRSRPFMLTEGSVVERLRRTAGFALDQHIENTAVVFDDANRNRLSSIYREYIEIAQATNVPMAIYTPTWRANSDRLLRSGFGTTSDVNVACCKYMRELRAAFGSFAKSIYLGGLIGCKGDAYDPVFALNESQASDYHREQVLALKKGGVDFLIAQTLPALPEATGIAEAMSECDIPYIISFIVDKNGILLDGTSLGDAIQRIDGAVTPEPLAYMINCTHSQAAERALASIQELTLRGRVMGFQGNASKLPPALLDKRPAVDAESASEFAIGALRLHREYGVKMLGGCCGTDISHIQALSDLLMQHHKRPLGTT